jgi:putative salt-induced outer membrane protein YdiY
MISFCTHRVFLYIAALSATAAFADQLVMKNGDRITGSIIKQDGKVITIKSDSFGVITAPWDQVASVTTSAPLTVALKSGSTTQSTITTSNGQLQIGGNTVAPGDVTALRNADEQRAYERLLHPGWGQLWAGGGNFGLAGTAGNAKTQTITTAFNAARATNTDKTSIYFNAIRASALVSGKNADTAQAVRGGVGYSRNLTKRVFFNGFNDYEYDKFQSLDLRFVIGGGVGYNVIKNDRTRLDLLGGLAYNRESFSTGLKRNSTDAYWGDDYNYKLSAATNLYQSFRMFNSLNDTGRYRVNFDVGATTKLTKWLTWNLALSDRYLSRPVAGRKTNDWIYTTGLGFTFAQ